MDSYYIPTGPGEAEFTEKRSSFLGHVRCVETEEEAKEFIAAMKKQYHDARHNCWCYRIQDGPERYSDDGEPQGSAGIPMLEVLKRENITNAVCVVTRYFGGVLLGAGGLVRAYSQGAAAAINACGVGVMHPTARYLMEIQYPLLNRMDYFLKDQPVLVEDRAFTDVITYTLIVRCADEEAFLRKLTDVSEGAVEPLRYEELYLPWPEEAAP